MSQETVEKLAANAVARRAAARLAEDVDPSLPALTERAIVEGEPREGMRSFDPTLAIALGGFLLSVAQFGWTVYRDLKEDREEAAKEAAGSGDRDRAGLGALLARRIRVGMETPPGVTPERRDRIVEVVVEEILRHEPGAGPGDGAGGPDGWDRTELR